MIPTHVVTRNAQPWLWLHQSRTGWHYSHVGEELHWYALLDQLGHYQAIAEVVEWAQMSLV